MWSTFKEIPTGEFFTLQASNSFGYGDLFEKVTKTKARNVDQEYYEDFEDFINVFVE